MAKSTAEEPHVVAATDTLSSDSEAQAMPVVQPGRFFNAQGQVVKHRINSVPGFSETFPDQNDVQLEAANRHGVKPVENRSDAETRKKELVYVGANPYYHVDRLRSSIPYLVPRAANIGINLIATQSLGRRSVVLFSLSETIGLITIPSSAYSQ